MKTLKIGKVKVWLDIKSKGIMISTKKIEVIITSKDIRILKNGKIVYKMELN